MKYPFQFRGKSDSKTLSSPNTHSEYQLSQKSTTGFDPQNIYSSCYRYLPQMMNIFDDH